jgi:[acyl-carrier-protein] S-malonyltransferase
MFSPVRWEASVRGMISAGADIFAELGPGRTLCGLIGKIDPAVRCFPLSEMKDIEMLGKELGLC